MADREITLPVQRINADDSWGVRTREKLRELAGKMGPSPAERVAQEAEASKSFADLGTAKGMGSRAAAYLLGPMAGAVPETPVAAAAMGGAMGALNGYADDTEHKLSSTALGAGGGALLSGTAAKLFGARPAKIAAEVAAPERDPANMLEVAKRGKAMMKELSPAELEARRRWVHTNSSEIQKADAARETTGEYGQLAQQLKRMAEKHPSPPATLYRGAHLPAEAVDDMARSGSTITKRMESWSTNPETSQAFALGKNIPGKVPVIFRQQKATGLALNPLESEVLVPTAKDYRVQSIGTAPDGTKIVDVVVDTGRAAREAARGVMGAAHTLLPGRSKR
jgi:hypothetical protein